MTWKAAGVAGIVTQIVHLIWLGGIAFFDGGSLAPDWSERILPMSLVAVPLLPAAVGMSGKANGFLAASLAAGVLSVFSLAGATLPLLVPASLYLIAAIKGSREATA